MIIVSEKYYYGNQIELHVDIIIIFCCLFLIINLFVPLIYVVLNISILYFDIKHSASTLGTSVASLTIFSLLGNSILYKGSILKNGFIYKLNDYIYRLFKKIINIRIFHLHAYFAYAICSFAAFTFHILDESWLKGETLGKMLTSSYLCRFHTPFVQFQNIFPSLFNILSIIGVIGQSLFQLLLPFGLFFKLTKLYIIVWGWIFIINCTVFFQLSYLPLIEIILWISLFHFRSGIGINLNESIFKKIFYKNKLYICLFSTIYSSYLFFYYDIPKVGNLHTILLSKINFSVSHPPHYLYYKLFGLDIPNVFNYDDLKMSNQWLATTRSFNIDHSNSTFVPITHYNGEKGWYQQFDFMYFGNSVRYRRHLIDQDPFIHRDNCSYCQNLIHKRILFDYRFNNFSNNVYYRCLFYQKSDQSFPLFELNYLVKSNHSIHRLN